MADNVPITAGSGTNVATDDVAGVHFQRVKLVDGTLDSSTAIPGDATNGLDVDVTRVQGSVTVAQATAGNLNATVAAGSGFPGVATDGSAIISTGTLSMGTDGTNAQTMRMSTAGEQYVFIGGDDGAGGFQTASFDATLTDAETNSVSHLNVHSRGAVWNPAANAGVGGWDRVRGDTTNGMDVDVTRVSGNVTVVQATGSNLNAVVSGTVTANLAAGTNNIGDVDVLSVPAPLNLTGGGTEASALRVTIANNSTGVVAVTDNGTTLSVDDGGGILTVDGSVTVTQGTAANLLATVTAGSGFVQPATAGSTALTAGPQLMGSDGTLARAVQTTTGGVLKVDGSASTQPVSGTVTVTQATAGNLNANVSGTVTANLAAGTNNIGDVDVLTVPAPLNVTGGGTEASALRVTIANDSTGVLSVDDNGTTISVDDGGGILTVDGTVTANLAAGTNNIGDVDVLSVPAPLNVTGSGTQASSLRVNIATDNIVAVDGDVAHGTTDSGNPLKLGAKTIAHGAAPTAVAAGARTDLYANRHGVLFTMGGHPNIQTIKANYTAAQTGAVLVTVGAAQKIVVTRVSVLASNANTVNPSVAVGTNTTTTLTNTDTMLSHPGLAPGSGVVEGNGAGILAIGVLDADLRFTCTVPTGGSLDVVASYYLIES